MPKVQLNFRLAQELIDALDTVGQIESRDRTNLVEFVLSDYLRTKYPEIWAKAYPELAEKRRQYFIDYEKKGP